eukprot:scaffold89235_cov60-Phaeocystis_antarctica.AAC.4
MPASVAYRVSTRIPVAGHWILRLSRPCQHAVGETRRCPPPLFLLPDRQLKERQGIHALLRSDVPAAAIKGRPQALTKAVAARFLGGKPDTFDCDTHQAKLLGWSWWVWARLEVRRRVVVLFLLRQAVEVSCEVQHGARPTIEGAERQVGWMHVQVEDLPQS